MVSQAPVSVMELLTDPKRGIDWVQSLLTVPTEDGRGIIPFTPTEQQGLIWKAATGRDITVKARQTRCSSILMAKNVRRMTTEYGLNCVVVTQTDQMTMNFRQRIKHHIEDLASVGLEYEIFPDNTDTLGLKGMKNTFHFASAEAREIRGIQTAHIVHASEVAHWPDEKARRFIGGLIPAVPAPPIGQFDMESTPAGAGGLFYEFAMDAMPLVVESKWTVHFYPWWLEKTYTIDTLKSLPMDITRMKREFQPTFEEKVLVEAHGLKVGQLLWRRVQTQELLKTGQYFSQEYVEDLLRCWLAAGTCFFHDEHFDHMQFYQEGCRRPSTRLTELPFKHPRTGVESQVSFQGPNVSIWEPPMPGVSYVGFVDAAAGVSGQGDYSAMVVLDAHSNRHVATLRIRARPQRFGWMVVALAAYYNNCFLGIERNSYGLEVLTVAQELGYKHLYYDIINQPQHPELGWYTSESSRELMLGRLRDSVMNHRLVTLDTIAVGEMGNFSWRSVNRRGSNVFRAEAAHGHDDLVIALAGAVTIAPYAPAGKGWRPAATGAEYTDGQMPILNAAGVVMGLEPKMGSKMPWLT